MGRINRLTGDVFNKISAGEVVERPASVVKELVENCIDAEASRVTIAIKGGGTSFIEVSDNGCGIAEDDIEDSRLFFTMYGDATYSVLRSRYNIDYVKAVKALMKRQQEAYIEGLKQELQKKIAEREFDIKQIDVEIQNAKLDNTLPEQLEVLMEEKKELQNSLYQMKKDLRSGNYTNSL